MSLDTILWGLMAGGLLSMLLTMWWYGKCNPVAGKYTKRDLEKAKRSFEKLDKLLKDKNGRKK
jgi:hypothetical protein